LWRAGCVDEAHVRFGKRVGEIHRWKHRQGAPVRLHHVNIRLAEHKLCLLVMIGVRADGRKELVALADGYRESWTTLCDEISNGTLFPKVQSWIFGNNVEGKSTRSRFYLGGLGAYRGILADVANRGYQGFDFRQRRSVSGE
jgi:hypothetical protein